MGVDRKSGSPGRAGDVASVRLGSGGRRPRIAVLYHYLFPDDVVSARLYEDLCGDLARRGWDVEARPSNRGCRDESVRYPLRERWRGVEYRRVWRPGIPQATTPGRLLNAGWLIGAWATLLTATRSPPDVVLVGTDPILSVAVAPLLRRLRKSIRIAHWVHDLYPDAIAADGLVDCGDRTYRALAEVARRSLGGCDLIVDLGPRMRERLAGYGHCARVATIPPWALEEPASPAPVDQATRRRLFGDARLALLYSGNFGRAHTWELPLALARRLRGQGVHLCFAVRGNRVAALRAAIRPDDDNVSFAEFASEAELARHLGAADVHVVTLRPEWSGLVVPSKFFGALAVGRPVLYAGAADSDVARWITEHGLGWVLSAPPDVASAADHLRELLADPERLDELRLRCQRTYSEQFARSIALERWDDLLRELL